MARTAVVNPKRRRKGKTRRYGSARRKRRRNPPSTTLSGARRKRRRNPATVSSSYSSGGYRRRPNPKRSRRRSSRRRNPGDFQGLLDNIMEVAPAATAGVQIARAAFKMAGDFEPLEVNPSGGPAGVAPGIKHALAGVLAAEFGGRLVGDMLGDASKGQIAMHAAIGFVGDVFLHKRFLVSNQFAAKHLYLGDWDGGEDLSGFSNESAIGDTQYYQAADGQVYALNGASLPGDPQTADLRTLNLSGFSNQSAIGSVESSFGYSRC
jgi:hypothetical protein